MQSGEVRNPIVVLVLFYVTCGIYGLYWIFTVLGEINGALGREEYNPVVEILLTFVTCGLWSFWLLWRMSESIVEIEKSRGAQPKFEAPILFIISLFIPGILMQISLNNAWESGGAGI